MKNPLGALLVAGLAVQIVRAIRQRFFFTLLWYGLVMAVSVSV